MFLEPLSKGIDNLDNEHANTALSHTAYEISVPEGKVYLQVHGDKDFYSFAYSTDGNNFETLDKVDVRYISSETAGGFTGIYLGLFAISFGESKAYADFDKFDYTPKSQNK